MATRRAQSLAVGIVHMQGPIAQHCVSTLHGLHVMAARRGQHCGSTSQPRRQSRSGLLSESSLQARHLSLEAISLGAQRGCLTLTA